MGESNSILGCEVQDTVSGLKGIVVNRNVNMAGMVQYGVQPQLSKGSNAYPDAYNIDEAQLKVLRKDVTPVVPATPTDVVCGMEVKDLVSGFTGIVTWMSVYTNGCTYANVEGKDSKERKQETRFLPVIRLEQKGKGLLAKLQAKMDKREKKPGGPVSRQPRL